MECGSEMDEDRESPTEQTALEKPPVIPPYLKSMPVKKLRHPTEKSLIPTVIVSTMFVVGGLAFGLPLVVVLTVVVLVVGVVRIAVASCCASRKGYGFIAGCTGLVSAVDAFWLHDSDFNRYVAHCLFFVERGLDIRMAREIMQSRVIEKTNESGDRAFARFTQKVVSAWAGYCWVDDADFTIENHVFEERRPIKSRHRLRRLLSTLPPLRRDRPLWEARLVRGYGQHGDTVLIARAHHALSDGVTFSKLLANFMADQPQSLRLKPRVGGTTFPFNAFRAAVVAPLTLLGWLLCGVLRRECNPLSGTPRSGKRTVGWSSAIRQANVDRIRQVARCSVNDVLVAAARGAVRDYFQQQCGVKSPPDITMSIPLDLRYEPATPECFPELGAGFAVVNARLPTRTEGAIPGLWEVRQKMDNLKASCDPVVMYGAIHYLTTLMPACLCRWLVRTVLRSASLSFCSLPGPERPVTLASCRLKAAAFWMSAQPEAPLAFCVYSYAGCFHVTVSADSGTVAQPRLLLRGFIAHLDRMYSIVAKRKTPGQERRRSSFTAERRREEILKPSVTEINSRLRVVQGELHETSRRLELVRLAGLVVEQRTLEHRLEELKEEFVELIAELRKRKTGAVSVDIEQETPYDHDLDGALRRPAGRRPSFPALSALLSTSRPLLTQHVPAVAQQALYHVPSDPDMENRSTPEQQRALLDRRREECYLSRGGGSHRLS